MTEFERRVRWALAELERGDFATAGRDYGRGVAFACRHIRDSIAEDDDSLIITYSPEEIAKMDDFAASQNAEDRDPLSLLVENTFVEGMDHGLSFAAIADEIVSVIRSELMSDQADSVLLFGRTDQRG